MIIERMQVEDGFLDGLDLPLRPGLNVLIGPRGAGKTSIIELIRFCLDVQAFTARAQEGSVEHALSVLKGGQVTLTIDVAGEKAIVERSASEKQPRIHPQLDLHLPTILSQREIEQIGLDSIGRLRLIDAFRSKGRRERSAEERVIRLIDSLSEEIRDLSNTVDGLVDSVEALTHVPEALAAAIAEEDELLHSMESSRAEQEQLKQLTDQLTRLAVRTSNLDENIDRLREWSDQIERVLNAAPAVESAGGSPSEPSFLGPAESAVKQAQLLIRNAIDGLAQATVSLEASSDQLRGQQLAASETARELRRKLDEGQKGAGALSKRVSDLKQQSASMAVLADQISEREERIAQLQNERQNLLDELDQVRLVRFEARRDIASRINRELGPRIEVKVHRYGMQAEYVSALAESLQGSRLHYNVLAPTLAASMSPRELVEAVEGSHVASIQSKAELTEERAQRLVSAIREFGADRILTAPIEDGVELRLLDGADYKNSEEVSTGQRCTMVLPILLEHRDRVLIVDQPEDHLDNSFIVSTVVQAIANRSQSGQLILATHNANIPVLGGASQVVSLDSDGQRGFYRSAADLDDPRSVEAITTVMEGGAEAFRRRAEFYRERTPVGPG